MATESTSGNWKKHILVNCSKCNCLMGYHVKCTTAICVVCELNLRRPTQKTDK